MTPLISLCHASARMPDGWQKAAQHWFDTADRPEAVEHILCIDDGKLVDPGWPFEQSTLVLNYGRKCAVDAWNRSAEFARGKLLITLSDDWFAPRHWDRELLRAVPNLDGEYVLDVDNQDNSYPLLPFSILTHAYYKRLGYLFYPEYIGMMADWEFTDVARRDGVVISARHLKFTHADPTKGTAQWDAIYERQRRPEAQLTGKLVYERRKAERFPALERMTA
jgi:hypothetical protein